VAGDPQTRIRNTAEGVSRGVKEPVGAMLGVVRSKVQGGSPLLQARRRIAGLSRAGDGNVVSTKEKVGSTQSQSNSAPYSGCPGSMADRPLEADRRLHLPSAQDRYIAESFPHLQAKILAFRASAMALNPL
jgi:hypothetical protein